MQFYCIHVLFIVLIYCAYISNITRIKNTELGYSPACTCLHSYPMTLKNSHEISTEWHALGFIGTI